MTVPSDPPASVTPAAFKTWAQNVSDTAQDHETRVDALESATYAPGTPITRTAGNYTLNSTTWADVDNTLDRSVAASAGDVIAVTLSAYASNEGLNVYLDAATVVAGSPTKYASNQTGTPATAGVQAWTGHASALTAIGGTAFIVLASEDIAAGVATVRLRYATSTAANKTLRADAGRPLQFAVVNLGTP